MIYRGIHVDDSGHQPPVVCDVKPMTVIEDSERVISLFIPVGTATLMPRPTVPGAPKPWAPGEWQLVPATWDRWNTLFLHIPGEWRSTWVMWSADWEFLGWYVNMEEPLRRTEWGFDNRDQQLDILVSPEGEWQWKDEADFERACNSGLISPTKASRVRESAARAIDSIEREEWPFEVAAADWRPTEFDRPEMPKGAGLTSMLRWPRERRWDAPRKRSGV